MFFPVSKIFWFLAEPVQLLGVVALVGAGFALTRYARIGRIVMAGAILGLALCLLSPLGALLLRPLETRFPAPGAELPTPTGIIVLGGAISLARTQASGQVVLTSDANRLTSGAELARRYPGARLVFSGGSGELAETALSEAGAARELWRAIGVPEARMEFESRSRNTWENAVFTRDLLAPKPGDTWLLVTSAWHMPRAIGIFRRVGFRVVPYPVAQRTLGGARDLVPQPSIVDRVFMLDTSVREWIGLLVYYLTGKTDALFPAPREQSLHAEVDAGLSPNGSSP
jgi:uncharacterized SAM-binding protein YcdF (DUF218 family)